MAATDQTGQMSKRQWLTYLGIGILFYSIFLTTTFPASWLAWGLNKFDNGVVSLKQPEGSIWHGKADLIVRYPHNSLIPLGRTEWRINPFWLMIGKLSIGFQAIEDEIQASGTVQATFSSIQLHNTKLLIPAPAIAKIYAPAEIISPKGTISITTDAVKYDKEGLHGESKLTWLQAGSDMTSVQPLGDYELLLTANGATTDIKLVTLKGDLELSGKGSWQTTGNGQINFNGTARPRGKAAELEAILSLLGRDMGGGRRLLKLNTKMPLAPM